MNMLYDIGFGAFTAQINTLGAELYSLKYNGEEFLYDGTSPYWSSRSPVCFPVVGRLKNGVTHIGGREYKMGCHGFASGQEFKIKSISRSSVCFSLSDNETTREMYPYSFELNVEYSLSGYGLAVDYTVINKDREAIYFSIGAHEGWRIPEEENFDDYDLIFSEKEKLETLLVTADTVLLSGEKKLISESADVLPLTYELFKPDAIVLDKIKSKSLTLKNSLTGRGVTVGFEGFTQLGIWTTENAPFVCIEPWYGVCDSDLCETELSEKYGIVKLSHGSFHARHTVRPILGEAVPEKLEMKIASGLAKARIDGVINDYENYNTASALLGDRLYFSALYQLIDGSVYSHKKAYIKIESELNDHIKASVVEQIPLRMPHYASERDGDYTGHEPGLYPDLLVPISNTPVYIVNRELKQLLFELNVPENISGGSYQTVISLVTEAGETLVSAEIDIKVIPVRLPAQKTVVTQWFYCDCLADYYGIEIFGEKHWKIIENYAECAKHNGINTLLTPVFTPALDTAVGRERPTTQLVDIKLENGRYFYNYEKLHRWVQMCRRVGIEYLEIPHFFTQWGAAHSPKFMADVNGEKKRIFGWETELDNPDFGLFLRDFIKNLIVELKSLGVDKKCIFHISDEPKPKHIENYKKAKALVWDLLKDYPVRDALSDIEFYNSGVVTLPIPAVSAVDKFIGEGVPGLWTYYCCGQGKTVTNRFIAMPSSRVRIIGAQMFRHNIGGFLQWGFNFWNNQYSIARINPYLTNDGDYFAPAGDTFSVYPAADGTAYESLHLIAFTQALYDIRAFELASAIVGENKIDALIDSEGTVTFKAYPKGDEYLLKLREAVNGIIEKSEGLERKLNKK